jgi:hypothetical protein
MKASNGMTFPTEDMEFLYQAVHHLTDALEKYCSWIANKEGTPLPGMETAIKEIQEEINTVRAIQIKIYNKCFTKVSV